MLVDGTSFSPMATAVVIRSMKNIANQDLSLDAYFSYGNDQIAEGGCTPISISPRTSARCTVRLGDGRIVDAAFKTDSLKIVQLGK